MPFNWTAEAERQMLFLIIDHMETRPSTEAYQKVASVLGGGLNANAVSQKFYKLKKEAEKLAGPKENGEAAASPVTTQAKPKAAPRKRKGKNDEDGEVATPAKKGRKKSVKKEEEPELEVPAVKEEQQDDTEEGDEGEQNGGENGHEDGDEEVENEASA